MPGESGSLAKGERLCNWLWYYNCSRESKEFTEIMSDTDGHLRTNTLLAGKIRPEVWMKLKSIASELLNRPFLDIVSKAENPFISTIRDLAVLRAAFYDSRLLLVGEALTVYSPHTGISFNQNALDCLLPPQGSSKGEDYRAVGRAKFCGSENDIADGHCIRRVLSI